MSWKGLLIAGGLAGIGALFFGVAGAAGGGAVGGYLASKVK